MKKVYFKRLETFPHTKMNHFSTRNPIEGSRRLKDITNIIFKKSTKLDMPNCYKTLARLKLRGGGTQAQALLYSMKYICIHI